jgi:hypothetical protein
VIKSKILEEISNTFARIDFYRISASVKTIIAHKYFPVVLLIVLNLGLGGLIVKDYGESWDEANNRLYGEQSINAYTWWTNKDFPLENYLGPTNQRYRGAAYPMLVSIFASWMQTINNDWLTIDLWHFANFLFFQLGVLILYMICLRFANIWAAFGATLLFVTQPLLWGHAFINSKDIPLMVCFLGSIAMGFKMVDAFSTAQIQRLTNKGTYSSSGENLHFLVIQDWRSIKSLPRKIFMLQIGVFLAIILTWNFYQNLITAIITKGYYASPSNILGILFSRLANNSRSVPLDAYVQKGRLLYEQVAVIVLIFSLGVFFLFGLYFFRNSLGKALSHIRKKWDLSFSKWAYLLIAAIMLGLAVSTRACGAFAGALIFTYFLTKSKKRLIPTLIIYALVAIFVTYVTWPYLWRNPVGNMVECLAVNSNFEWTGNVLFRGVEYNSTDLPATYLPMLLILQFTEPVCFLLGIGTVLAISRIIRRTESWGELLIILTWFFVPLLLVVIFTPIMYDNFRHWLFIVPPIFVLAGLALDALFMRFKSKFVNLAILCLFLLPGIYGGITLHPYQYIFYNGFAGGVSGAFRQFELDYWVTSYREATLYLNEEAPPDSQVLVVGPRRIFINYARADLKREWFKVDQLEETTNPVFIIISTRYNADIIQFPEAEIVYRVSRDGADLAVVKQIK